MYYAMRCVCLLFISRRATRQWRLYSNGKFIFEKFIVKSHWRRRRSMKKTSKWMRRKSNRVINIIIIIVIFIYGDNLWLGQFDLCVDCTAFAQPPKPPPIFAYIDARRPAWGALYAGRLHTKGVNNTHMHIDVFVCLCVLTWPDRWSRIEPSWIPISARVATRFWWWLTRRTLYGPTISPNKDSLNINQIIYIMRLMIQQPWND